MRYLGVLIIVLLIIILIISVSACSRMRIANDYLTGFWVGNNSFLEESELENMYIYISALQNGVRECYIVIIDDESDIIMNECFQMKYNTTFKMFMNNMIEQYKFGKFTMCSDICLKFDNNSPIKATKLNMNIINSSLILHDGKQIYACLHKDGESSIIAASS